MAQSSIPSYTTGDLITAAHANTYWRDNEAAHWTLINRATNPGGRLTLETGVPVSSADQSAKATLYYTPHVNEFITLYDGAGWNVRTFAEISLDISGFTADKNYDIWAYDNSGTVTLDSTIWTDNFTRATALAYQDGVLVKSGTETRRYLGTIRINGTGGQCEDTITARFVWNMYNQVLRATGATGLGANTDQTALGKTYYVIGLAAVVLSMMGGKTTATAASYCGLYLLTDTASLASADANAGIWSQTALEMHSAGIASKLRVAGYHYVAMGLNVQTTAGVLSEGYISTELMM